MTDREYMENKVRHAFNKGYDLGFKDGKEKAKSQQPCEDAISREKVLEGLASIAKAKAKSDAQKSMMGRTMFFVEQLPSVSTEKTGHWIEVKNSYKCSNCLKYIDCIDKYEYCPYCGAKMLPQTYKAESEG